MRLNMLCIEMNTKTANKSCVGKEQLEVINLNIEFKTDINELGSPSNKKINLIGVKFPNNNDIYYRAKQNKLIDQYAGARIFL